MSISIEGLDKAAVLAALYNASRPLGMGFLHYDSTPMTVEQARKIWEGSYGFFDYLQGRVMKVDLTGDSFDPWGYDRDNGTGAAQDVIDTLRQTADPADASLLAAGHLGKVESAEIVKRELHTEHTVDASEPGVIKFGMGLDDVADILGPAVDKALDE